MNNTELNKATELLLGETFIQKGSKFRNKVIKVSFKSGNDNEIIVTYQTLSNYPHTAKTKEYIQFLELHFI